MRAGGWTEPLARGLDLDSAESAEVQRVLLRTKPSLRRVYERVYEKMLAAAHAYAERGLADVPGMELPHFDDPLEHVFHLYVVRHPDADALAQRLAAKDVSSRAYYRRPVHLQPAMERYGGESLDLPGTVEAARTHLALPMGTQLSESQVDEVVAACASGST